MGIAVTVAKRNFGTCPRYPLDERVADGFLALCVASATWDPDKARFSTYAWHCCWNYLLKRFTYNNKRSGIYGQANGMLDKASENKSPRLDDIDELYCDLLVASERLAVLNEKQRYLLKRYYIDGANMPEIAAEDGVSKQAVHQKMNIIRRKARFGVPRLQRFAATG